MSPLDYAAEIQICCVSEMTQDWAVHLRAVPYGRFE